MALFGSRSKISAAQADHAALDALSRSQAMIEFSLDGTIMNANGNFLSAMGYELAEIQGKHHSIFVELDYARSAEYKEFWMRLGHGEFDAAEYKRIGKGGKEVWIQASYNPVLDAAGTLVNQIADNATDDLRTQVEPFRDGSRRQIGMQRDLGQHRAFVGMSNNRLIHRAGYRGSKDGIETYLFLPKGGYGVLAWFASER